MTTDKIVRTILNTFTPELSKSWRHEVGTASHLVELIFRSKMPTFLNIKATAACFNPLTALTWQGRVSDEACIVFEGGIGGTLVQASFVLEAADQ